MQFWNFGEVNYKSNLQYAWGGCACGAYIPPVGCWPQGVATAHVQIANIVQMSHGIIQPRSNWRGCPPREQVGICEYTSSMLDKVRYE